MMTRLAALLAFGFLVAAQAAAQPIAVPFQSLFDGNALTGVAALAASADGRHVYAAGNGDRAIAAFSRNPANGRLGRVGVYRDGDDGFSRIALTARFAFSPDELTLYAAGGDSIAVLHRDADSGELTPGPTVRGGFGINQLTDIEVAADGDRLFAVGSSSVAMFAIDESGALEHVATVTDGAQFPALAGASAVETAGGFIYVASEIDRAVTVLQAGATALTLVQTLQVADSDLLGSIADLAISADANHLYAAVVDGDRVVVLQRGDSDGRIAVSGAVGEAAPGRGLVAPSRLAVSGDDLRVYVASGEESSLALLDRDTTSGELTAVRAAFDGGAGGVNGIGGASDIAIGPAQTHVYVSGAADAAIGLFDAALSFLAIERNSAGAINGMRQPAAIAVAPDGAHAYVAGYGSGAIAIFRREANGALVFTSAYRGGGSRSLVQPISLAFTPDGSTLVVADFGAEAVQTLRRDTTTGALTALGLLDSATVGDLRGVSSVAVSPDASLVAATSLLSGSALLLTLNPSTGDLALRATMPAFAQPSFGTFSADGRNLYTTSSGSSAVVAFTSSAAGPFPQLEVVRSRDGIQGLVSPASLALSPDGDNLYVASGGGLFAIDGSNAVVAFTRASDGALTFRQALIDGEDGVAGILGATAVAVSPSGNLVAVAGFGGNSLGVFGRDATSGYLNFVAAQFDGSDGANGLGGASSLAFSPGGGELYVTGFADDAITSFRVPTPMPTPTATPSVTPTATQVPTKPAATPTVTAPSTPTPDATPATPRCPGDCDAGETVAIAELIRCVNIALGSAAVETCLACDTDGDGQVGINELIQAVSAALNGCP